MRSTPFRHADGIGQAGGGGPESSMLRLILSPPLLPQPDRLCPSGHCRIPRVIRGSEMNHRVVALAFPGRNRSHGEVRLGLAPGQVLFVLVIQTQSEFSKVQRHNAV